MLLAAGTGLARDARADWGLAALAGAAVAAVLAPGTEGVRLSDARQSVPRGAGGRDCMLVLVRLVELVGLAKLMDGTIRLPRKNPHRATSPQASPLHRQDALEN